MNKIQIYKSPSISLFSRLLNSSSIILPYFLLKGTRGSKRKEIEDRIKMALLIRLKNLTLFNSSSHGYHLIVFPRFNNLIAPSPSPHQRKMLLFLIGQSVVQKLDMSPTSGRRSPSPLWTASNRFPFSKLRVSASRKKSRARKSPRRLVDLPTFQRKKKCLPGMYSNDYDDGTLMNSYIRWSKRYNVTSLPFFIVSFLFLRPRVAHVHRFITFDREIETRPRFDFTNSFCADWPDFINVPSGFIRRTSTCITTTKVRTRN